MAWASGVGGVSSAVPSAGAATLAASLGPDAADEPDGLGRAVGAHHPATAASDRLTCTSCGESEKSSCFATERALVGPRWLCGKAEG